MPSSVDYQAHKIPAGTKPWHLLYWAWVDDVEADMKLSATEAWVQAQIATGGVDWNTFGNPNDVLTLNSAGDTPEGIPKTAINTVYNFNTFV